MTVSHLHNGQGRSPVCPEAGKQDPEDAVPGTQLRPFHRCSKPPVHMKYASGAEVYFGNGGNSFGGIFTGEKGKIEVNRNR